MVNGRKCSVCYNQGFPDVTEACSVLKLSSVMQRGNPPPVMYDHSVIIKGKAESFLNRMQSMITLPTKDKLDCIKIKNLSLPKRHF